MKMMLLSVILQSCPPVQVLRCAVVRLIFVNQIIPHNLTLTFHKKVKIANDIFTGIVR